MTSLESLTRPFTSFHRSSPEVKQNFLAGVPWANKLYPGPFQGVTNQGERDYLAFQGDIVRMYPSIATKPLREARERNIRLGICGQYGSAVDPVPVPRGQDEEETVYQPPSQYQYQGQGQQQPTSEPGTGSVRESFHDMSITDPQNQTGFGELVPRVVGEFQACRATNNPLLDIKNRPISHFSHNNMVPYYGAKLTQNMQGTNVPQAGDNNPCGVVDTGNAGTTPFRQRLQLFTGSDEMYMHKRESGPRFSPAEQQTTWVNGTPLFRPDMDRYKTSIYLRNNESPIEAQHVGPGLGLDYSVPAAGGFQQFFRILPNNVNDYKANQLEGRVKGGKWFVNHPTSQFINGMSTNRPKTYIPQSRRPTMPQKFVTDATNAANARLTDFNALVQRGKQSRPDTEQGAGFGQFNSDKSCTVFGQAPVGKIMKAHVPMPSNNLATYAQGGLRPTFKRGAAGYNEKNGYWECPEMQQGSQRFDLIGGPKGIVSQNKPLHAGIYVNDTDRGQLNPFVINATGTASMQGGIWNPNSAQDLPRVTRKETLQFSHTGNLGGQTSMSTSRIQDQLRTTRKETTQYANNGNMQYAIKSAIPQIQDQLRTTRKETTQYAFQGNLSGAAGLPGMQTSRAMFEGGVY